MLERGDWLNAARKIFISEGVAGVRVDRLARALRVSRGGFYYRFKSRADLLDALQQDWRDTNNAALLRALCAPGDPVGKFRAFTSVINNETEFSARYDMAMRAWALMSPKVARLIRSIDEELIEAVRALFLLAGYSQREASVRARVFHYHRIGYCQMRLLEDSQTTHSTKHHFDWPGVSVG